MATSVLQCEQYTFDVRQEIWANAHETHESPWQFLFAGNLSLHLHPFRRNSLFCSQKSPKNHL